MCVDPMEVGAVDKAVETEKALLPARATPAE